MDNVDVQPHIRLSKGQVRPVVLVVGDPGRALKYASQCDSMRELAYNREYRSFDCCLNGAKFSIISHGVGTPGALICFEELIKCGAKVIIRAGSAGSLQPDKIRRGSVVVAHSAVKESGATQFLEPVEIPAVSDWEVTNALWEKAKKHACSVHLGITVSADIFYDGPVLGGTHEQRSKCGVDIVEMEAAGLFVIGRLRGIRTGCICAIDGSPLRRETGEYSNSDEIFNQAVQDVFKISSEVCCDLAKSISMGENQLNN